jgi:WD40 repeat protein
LASDDDNYQIISVASDHIIKVWDVRNYRCLQTFTDKRKSNGESLGGNVSTGITNKAGVMGIERNLEIRPSTIFYDEKYPCLLTGRNHLRRWPFKVHTDEEKKEAILDRPMCLAIYNSVFNQVVTAEMSTESVVRTWSVSCGGY